MVKLTIDDRVLEAQEGSTILRTAQEHGIPIPHFCYHPAFAPEGSCRLCLVEIEGLPKLELACSTKVRDGQVVRTRTPRVIEARKSVLEFFLAEHPLDCPVCDKAGECLLQDFYDAHGRFDSRMDEPKLRREKRLMIGDRLILDRERCVLCTRCVRFLKEVTGTGELGVVARGNHSEISTYESEKVDNNYAGNLVDICPVGAITDADFRFRARVWFLEPRPSICPLCGRGCNIYIDVHPGFPRALVPQRAYRVRPRPNPEVNGFWICDFGRYSYAYLDRGRLANPVQKKGGRETVLTFEKASQIIGAKLRALVELGKGQRVAVILNTILTNEELFLADRLFRKTLGLKNVFIADPPGGPADGFLQTAERTPNRRGAEAIGPFPAAPRLEELAGALDLLLLFGHFLAAQATPSELKGALDGVEAKYLWASHSSPLDGLVDIVVPTPVLAEKSGTLTNVDGRVQAIVPALGFCAEGGPEWRVLLDLARALGLDQSTLGSLNGPEDVLNLMKKEIPFFS